MIIDLSKIKSGFSDKLRAVTYCIALNKLSNKKHNTFFIYETKTKECPFKFIDLCKVKNIKIVKLKNKEKSNIKLNSYNTEITLENCIKNNPLKYVDNQELFIEWKKSYTQIQPIDKIIQKIKKIRLPKDYIGLHIRSTDRKIEFKKFYEIQFIDTIYEFQLHYFLKNIDFILSKITKIKNIYIASDDLIIKNEIIKKLKNSNFKIYFDKSILKKKSYRQTSGVNYVTDLFCLTFSNLILSTVGAGVTESAHLISKQKVKFIKWIDTFNIFIFLKILTILIYSIKRIKNFIFLSKF